MISYWVISAIDKGTFAIKYSAYNFTYLIGFVELDQKNTLHVSLHGLDNLHKSALL